MPSAKKKRTMAELTERMRFLEAAQVQLDKEAELTAAKYIRMVWQRVRRSRLVPMNEPPFEDTSGDPALANECQAAAARFAEERARDAPATVPSNSRRAVFGDPEFERRYQIEFERIGREREAERSSTFKAELATMRTRLLAIEQKGERAPARRLGALLHPPVRVLLRRPPVHQPRVGHRGQRALPLAP